MSQSLQAAWRCWRSHVIYRVQAQGEGKPWTQLMHLMTSAGCLEALAEPRALQLAFHTLHRPPEAATLTLALRLLHALSPTPAAAWSAAAAGGALYALSVLLPTAPSDEANRVRTGGGYNRRIQSPSSAWHAILGSIITRDRDRERGPVGVGNVYQWLCVVSRYNLFQSV